MRAISTVSKISLALTMMSLSGCSIMGAAGPSTGAVNKAGESTRLDANITIVDVTEQVARRVMQFNGRSLFSDVLGEVPPAGTLIGRGDVVDVMVWEAPPAVLFTQSSSDSRMVNSGAVGREANLPQQMVGGDGRITVPFAGSVMAAGRSPHEIERDIVARLAGKANHAEVVVRRVSNVSSNATVVGDVANSLRVPLSAKGERLLDALAAAGGVKQPVGKMTVQITRDGKVVSLPLDTVIRDARQNVRLQADDVVTVMFQPYSFTALGAVGNNAEVPFEATGVTLAQALGRIGGLQDSRSNLRGVFVFRLENPDAVDPALVQGARKTLDGLVPVVYRIDMRDPGTFFVAQSFPIKNKDIIYVSNAPVADFQKFLNLISTAAFSVVGITNNIP